MSYAFIIQEQDIREIIENIWHGHSILSQCDVRKQLRCDFFLFLRWNFRFNFLPIVYLAGTYQRNGHHGIAFYWPMTKHEHMLALAICEPSTAKHCWRTYKTSITLAWWISANFALSHPIRRNNKIKSNQNLPLTYRSTNGKPSSWFSKWHTKILFAMWWVATFMTSGVPLERWSTLDSRKYKSDTSSLSRSRSKIIEFFLYIRDPSL